MYVPEYTITNKILQNVASVEYAKAVAEHSVILGSWEKRQQKEADIKFIQENLFLEKIRVSEEEVKSWVDGIIPFPAGIVRGIKRGLDFTRKYLPGYEINEEDLSQLYKELQDERKDTILMYRSQKFQQNFQIDPSEILSQMTETLDWVNSLDGRETHPLVKAAIIKGRLTTLLPFAQYNETMGNLLALKFLINEKYTIRDFCHLEMAYAKDPAGYKEALLSIQDNGSEDLTTWIDFYTGAAKLEAEKKREEILILSKDTKISQISGKSKLTQRQERIVEYLQDYGSLQNKDFSVLFPNISEDSILRDLKSLTTKGIVVKKGKTKSSRYELK